MSLINTEASARCAHRCDDLEPFQRLPHREQTVKRVRLVQRVYHRAKASVLMKLSWRRLRSRRFLSFPGASGGRALPMLLFGLLMFTSCRREMTDQPKAKTFSESSFFKSGTNARPIPPNTVPRGDVREDEKFYTGLMNGTYMTELPKNLTPELLRRGRETHDAFCAQCHGRLGDGRGPVVRHGFPEPHTARTICLMSEARST